MSRLQVPIVCCVIGEGGSGGAVAIAAAVAAGRVVHLVEGEEADLGIQLVDHDPGALAGKLDGRESIGFFRRQIR